MRQRQKEWPSVNGFASSSITWGRQREDYHFWLKLFLRTKMMMPDSGGQSSEGLVVARWYLHSPIHLTTHIQTQRHRQTHTHTYCWIQWHHATRVIGLSKGAHTAVPGFWAFSQRQGSTSTHLSRGWVLCPSVVIQGVNRQNQVLLGIPKGVSFWDNFARPSWEQRMLLCDIYIALFAVSKGLQACFCFRDFAVAVPSVWYVLPANMYEADFFPSFKFLLKCYPFQRQSLTTI